MIFIPDCVIRDHFVNKIEIVIQGRPYIIMYSVHLKFNKMGTILQTQFSNAFVRTGQKQLFEHI